MFVKIRFLQTMDYNFSHPSHYPPPPEIAIDFHSSYTLTTPGVQNSRHKLYDKNMTPTIPSIDS